MVACERQIENGYLCASARTPTRIPPLAAFVRRRFSAQALFDPRSSITEPARTTQPLRRGDSEYLFTAIDGRERSAATGPASRCHGGPPIATPPCVRGWDLGPRDSVAVAKRAFRTLSEAEPSCCGPAAGSSSSENMASIPPATRAIDAISARSVSPRAQTLWMIARSPIAETMMARATMVTTNSAG